MIECELREVVLVFSKFLQARMNEAYLIEIRIALSNESFQAL